MLVKDLIKELQRLPEDANITIGRDLHDCENWHLAVKYIDPEERYWKDTWCTEQEIDFFFENRDKFPEKVRFRLEPNDEDYIKFHKETLEERKKGL